MIRICFFFCCIVSFVFGETFGNLVLKDKIKEPYIMELNEGVEEVEVTLDEEKLANLKKSLEDYIKTQGNDFIFPYFLARVQASYAHFYSYKIVDDEKAKESLEIALEYAKKTIELNDKFSDGYRLCADCYGELLDFKPPFVYGPIYGPRANKMLKKAIELNPNNPEAYLAKGRNLLFTPRIFGGSVKKALESFKKAEAILSDYHWAYIWQGEAYLKMKDKEKAKDCFEKALSLEPRNGWAKEELEKINE